MTQKKRIAYAFPTSTTADLLGFKYSGCFFIEYETRQGSQATDMQIGGFKEVCQDLLDSFSEADGEVCKMSLKYNSHFYERIK